MLLANETIAREIKRRRAGRFTASTRSLTLRNSIIFAHRRR
ncbi:MAG: hypothetical protein CM1200mP29_01680 [Verrucomicrobiota bacterium]|nr:MAG: hypothetical protein CM1200mP29_01680 [Verrucomicrobiota bacterium]